MATLTPTLQDHGYKNWVKGGLALKFSREGIENFVETNIDKFHQNILASLPAGPLCYNCSTENIVQCKYSNNFCRFSKNNCIVHNSQVPNKTSRPCPIAICNVIRDEILKQHRFNGPSWKNTDSSIWCRDEWQLATCYMSAGYTASTSAAQTDLPGLLSVVINNKIFDTEVTDDLSNKSNVFCMARDARNSILHNADMRLSDAELAAHITTLDNMLADTKSLAQHPDAIQARTLLQQLLNGTIHVTTRHEADVLAEALRSIDDKQVKAIAAVNKEKNDVQEIIKSEKEDALAAVNKEKNDAQEVIKSEKEDALAAVNKEKNDAQEVIKSEKDDALAAVNKEKDDAKEVINTKKGDALAAVNKERDDAKEVINTKKGDALAAVNKERDDAKEVINTKKGDALAAVNKERDDAKEVINTKKGDALAAVNKEKDEAKEVIQAEKDKVLATVNKEKVDAKKVINSKKDDALAVINKEKDEAKDNVLAAVNKEIDNARVVITSKKDDAVADVIKEKINAKDVISSKRKQAVTVIDNKEKLIVANLQKSLLEAHRAITQREAEVVGNLQRTSTDSYDKIKQDLKAELLSIYQDGEHLYTPLSPIDQSEDKHIEQLYVPPYMKLVDYQKDEGADQTEDNNMELLYSRRHKGHVDRPRNQKGKGTAPGMIQNDGKTIETYKDIFEEGNKKIYVVGEAGTGKTSFCQKIVSTWCQVQNGHIEQMSDDQQALAKFDFLFYISLRDETTNSCVDEMIKHSLLANKARLHEPLSKVLAEEKCLVILDGLDEWTTENKTASPSHINKGIPGRDSIRNCSVITTTRPWKLEVLQLKSSQIDAKVELLGIDKISSESLIQKIIIHLNDKHNSKKMYKDFISKIKENNFLIS